MSLDLAQRALEARIGATAPAFQAESIFFGKQLEFVQDKAPFRTACTSRRAGKTEGASGSLAASALAKPGSVNLYITLSRINAKRIVWRTLKNLNSAWSLGAEPNESELSLTFPNGSLIYLCGAKDKGEVEKFRGLGLGRVVIDEAQAMPAYIDSLIDDVIEPGLMDYDGDLVLTGTPAPVPVGYFYNCTQSQEWSHHEWTVFENPWIEKKSGKSAQQHLERALKRRGVTADHPSIQREFYGRWVYDPDALVFRFDASGNVYSELPGGKWETVIGVDLGFDDADAIAVLGFADGRPESHLREEWVGTKQTITQLADRLLALIKKYDPISIVMDTGGLGKKIAEEIRARHAIPVKAAEKKDKFSHIELLNDAMRSGRFFARADSRFAQDCMLVEWDKEKSTNDKLVISDRYHSDICDAVLYAYRESLHWLHEPPGPRPTFAQAQQEVEDAIEARLEETVRAELKEAEDLQGWTQ